jgi:hypothetical protein
MKTFSCNALSIALGLFLQILAFEQITFADNIYNQLNDQLKAGPDAAANYGRNIGIQNNPGGLRIPNLNSCVKLSNGTESCPSGNDKLIAHERSIPLAALMPGVLSTNADLHNSLNRRALENSSLLSEKTMRAVTSLLTESGIGQGIHHADVETMLLQLNMALHEIKVATVAKNILPETLPLTREVYNCIEERMQEEGWNYVDAFAQCQFDQPGVTVPSKPIQPGAMADGFFKYNPAYSNGPLNDGKEARLLDWIFNGAGGDQSGTRAAFFKEHWRYGDVVYKVERVTTPFPGATPLPGATPIPGTSGLPRARYQLLEEPDRAWIEYQKRIQEVFSAQNSLLRMIYVRRSRMPLPAQLEGSQQPHLRENFFHVPLWLDGIGMETQRTDFHIS